MDALIDEDARASAGRRRSATRPQELREKPGRGGRLARRSPTTRVRSAARTDNAIPEPPFWGVREIEVDLDEVYPVPRPPRAVQAALGRARQEGRGVAAGSSRATTATRASRRSSSGCGASRTTCTRGRGSATSPATPTATSWSIFDPEDHDREIERLVFPRQPQARPHLPGRLLPAARHRASATSSRCRRVTVGPEVTERIGAARGRRRVRRAALRPRARRAGGRGPGRVAARRGPRAGSASSSTRAAATRGATPPARTSPSTRRSGACSASTEIGMTLSGGYARRARAVDGGDHRPPPAGRLLRHEVGLHPRGEEARDELIAGTDRGGELPPGGRSRGRRHDRGGEPTSPRWTRRPPER